MTAAALLAELQGAGIGLSARGDRLRVEAKPGAVSAALLARLAAEKPALLALLAPDPIRAHLLTLAADEGLQADLVHGLDRADIATCAGLPDDTLRSYLRARARSEVMHAGGVPEGYTQASHCAGCGPVWLWRGPPTRLLACPWCFRRKAGKAFPRPAVTCGDCLHYLPHRLNPEAGAGGCRAKTGLSRWPMARHRCAAHVPTDPNEGGEPA